MKQSPYSLIAQWTDELAGVQPIDWSRMDGGRLLLTGCTGPFGMWILNRISRACEHEGLELGETTVVTRHAASAAPWLSLLSPRCRLRVVECDIRQIDTLQLEPTHVIHGATTNARETSAGANPEAKFETVVDGTRALTRLLREREQVDILYLSSGIAYGINSEALIKEADMGAPYTLDCAAALGHAKRAAEFLLACHSARTGSRVTIARCFSFSGPGIPLDIHYALGNFIAQALYSDEIIIKGHGTEVRSYMHLGDMALWIATFLARKFDQPNTSMFNVGSDQNITIEDLAKTVANTLNPKSTIKILKSDTLNKSGNRNQSYVPSLSKAKSELRLDIWTPLEKSIQQMALFEKATKGKRL